MRRSADGGEETPTPLSRCASVEFVLIAQTALLVEQRLDENSPSQTRPETRAAASRRRRSCRGVAVKSTRLRLVPAASAGNRAAKRCLYRVIHTNVLHVGRHLPNMVPKWGISRPGEDETRDSFSNVPTTRNTYPTWQTETFQARKLALGKDTISRIQL